MVNVNITHARNDLFESLQSRIKSNTRNIQRIFFLIIICLSSVANAEHKTYTMNEGINTQITSVFDCTPYFNGKVALGNDKFVYSYECDNNTNTKYAIYKISYTSRFSFTLSTKNEALDFFNNYLANKVTPYYQNNRMGDIRFSILSITHISQESSFADYLISYKWDGQLRLLQQGRFIFQNGHIADWSIASLAESGVAADEFNNYEKYFKINPLYNK